MLIAKKKLYFPKEKPMKLKLVDIKSLTRARNLKFICLWEYITINFLLTYILPVSTLMLYMHIYCLKSI